MHRFEAAPDRRHVRSHAAVLEDLASSDTAVLLAPARLERIGRFARGFPDTFSTSYLEVRLGQTADEVDYFIALSEQECREFIAAFDDRPVSPNGVGAVAWQRALELCRSWTRTDPRYTELRHVSSLFFEFDRPDSARARDPGLFLRLQRTPDSSALMSMLEALQPNADIPKLRLALDACLAAIAPHGRLMHIGSMARTHAPDLRLHVTVPRSELRSILIRLFPESDLHTQPSLVSCERGPDWLDLQLQICDFLIPSVGIEVSFGGQPPTDPRWQSWLSPFVDASLCSSEKLGALLAWPAKSQPDAIMELSHVKLAIHEHAQPTLKAYLGIWRP
jgi:hypothetical protein